MIEVGATVRSRDPRDGTFEDFVVIATVRHVSGEVAEIASTRRGYPVYRLVRDLTVIKGADE